MTICGVDIKGKEAILSVVTSDDEGNVTHINCNIRRLELSDHESAASLDAFMKAVKSFAHENDIKSFVIKSRKATGQMAAGGITFKIEALFQLSGTEVSFVSPPTLATFAKKSNLAMPPQTVNKYQVDAYRAAVWKLAKL